MGYIGSSALAVGAAAAVVLAIIVAFHDLALERLRKYCIPTPEEAEWAAAFVEVSDEDVDVLSYGEEQLGVILTTHISMCPSIYHFVCWLIMHRLALVAEGS